MTASPTPRTQLPPRLLPVLYFSAAHVALALAFGAVALDPRGVSGFFYHARMLGIVHLVTLGWITASILGSLYVVGPIAFATMMVIGVAYRLLPIILPAAMPSGPRLWISAVLLQAGVSGLFATLLLRGPLAWVFALTIVAGFAAFAWQVVWMLRRPRPRPPGLRRADPAVMHAGASFASLGIASVLGLWLAMAEPSSATLRIAMAYGVFGLVGFLAQTVVCMEGRLLPIFARYWAYANAGYRGPMRSQHEMPWRQGQELVFVLWLFGVPALAGGLAFDAVPFVRAGAWCLLAAALLDAVNVVRILRNAFVAPPGPRAPIVTTP